MKNSAYGSFLAVQGSTSSVPTLWAVPSAGEAVAGSVVVVVVVVVAPFSDPSG